MAAERRTRVYIEHTGAGERPWEVIIERPKRIIFKRHLYGRQATEAAAIRSAQDAEAYLYRAGETAEPPPVRRTPHVPCTDPEGRYRR